MNYTNVIILGDFNLHVNDLNDNNVMNFIESTQALALQQHVNFPTHTSGNTLNLVFTELFNELKIQKCTQDDFILDHCIVKFNLNVKRPDIIRKVISYCKLKDINIQNMINSVTVTYVDNLDGLVEQFDKALSKALDDVVPTQTKQQTVRKSIPWFMDEVKEHKQFMRRREKIWRRYKTEDTKTAFIKAQSKYKQQLRREKVRIISTKVIDCGTDTRKLYSLVNGLIGLTAQNPLPDNQDKDELVEEFGSFFMSKISKIWDELNDHPKYNPLSNSPPKLDCFKETTEDKVLKLINSMAAKTCGSDPIPSSLFKELAPHIIGHITTIVNESLRKGVVASKWKTSIIKPLLKKVGLDPIMKNYRPVSNLPFMLKLVERCMLAQFNKHCEDN